MIKLLLKKANKFLQTYEILSGMDLGYLRDLKTYVLSSICYKDLQCDDLDSDKSGCEKPLCTLYLSRNFRDMGRCTYY